MTKKKRQKILDAMEEKIRLARIAQSNERAANALKDQSDELKRQSDVMSEELEFKKQTDNRVNLSLHDYEAMLKEMEFLRSQYDSMFSVVNTFLTGYRQCGIDPTKVIEELRKQNKPEVHIDVRESWGPYAPNGEVKILQVITVPKGLTSEWKMEE